MECIIHYAWELLKCEGISATHCFLLRNEKNNKKIPQTLTSSTKWAEMKLLCIEVYLLA